MLSMSDDEAKLYQKLEVKAVEGYEKVADKMKETLKLGSLLLPLRMISSTAAAVGAKHVAENDDDQSIAKLTNDEIVARMVTKGGLDKAKAVKAAAELKAAQGNSECTICQDVIADTPAITGCGHIFCLECIHAVITEAAGDTGPCPLCRTAIGTTSLMQLKIPAPVVPVAATELEKLLKLAQQHTSTKLRALLASLQEMQCSDFGSKAVIFTQFAESHKALVKYLKKAGLTVVEIRGNMAQKARSRALEKFMTDPATNVFCLSLRSGAVGLTLTAASRCFLLEPCMNEGTELQAVNRYANSL